MQLEDKTMWRMNCGSGVHDRGEFTIVEFIQREKPRTVWVATKCQDIVSS